MWGTVMSALRYLLSIKCPKCNVSLFRATEPIAKDIVFCAECGAGSLYKEAVKKRKILPGYVTRTQIEEIFGEMGIATE